MEKLGKKRTSLFWVIMLSTALLVVAMIVLGASYNNSFKKQLYAQSQSELTLITSIKSMQIANWRIEKIGLGATILNNEPILREVSTFVKSGNKSSEAMLKQWMASMVSNNDFLNIQIIDSNGKVRLTVPGDTIGNLSYIRSIVREHIYDTTAYLSDFHFFGSLNIIHLDLTVPVRSNRDVDKAEALLIFRIDPSLTLYRLIQSWPLDSETSEALLVRKEGDSIVYLNELRHLGNAPLKLKLDSSLPDLVAAKAFAGIPSPLQGVDYRKEKVFAAWKKIPSTEWILISKTDESEIIDKYRQQIFRNKILTTLLIFTVLSVISALAWQRRVKFYRDKYENELEKQVLKKHYDYILKYANDIVLLVDTDLNIVEANDRAVDVYQYSYEELKGMKISLLRLPEFELQLAEMISKLSETGSATYETVHRRKDGTTFPVEISARVFEIDGVRYYQSIGRDITDRKKADEALKETELTYTAIFNTVTDAIYVHKLDGVFMDVNPGAERMYGYSKEELIGKTPVHVGAEGKNDLEELGQILSKVFETGKSEKFEFWGKRKNGEIFPKEVVASKGTYFGEDVIIATARDISDFKKIAADLTDAKEKAEENDRLKTAFLHNISHEIRTPMNAIVGFTSLLNDPDLDFETRQHFAGIVTQSTNQLLSIISDIVDISNIETNQVKLIYTEVDVNKVIEDIYEQFQITTSKQGLRLIYETRSEEKGNVIRTDSTKLIQVLSNLLSNAVKFTKQGSITFGYKQVAGYLEFFVRDTGIGIPAEYHRKIFDRFYQVDSDTSRQFGGAGLGLSICKAYTELLGGEIWVESVQGRGSTFYFTIPVNTVIRPEPTL